MTKHRRELAISIPPPSKIPFDPSASTFSCYKLDMSMDEIIAAVRAYRRGDDWREALDVYHRKEAVLIDAGASDESTNV